MEYFSAILLLKKSDCSNFGIMSEIKISFQHNIVYKVMLSPVMINVLSGFHLCMKLFTMKLVREYCALYVYFNNTLLYK